MAKEALQKTSSSFWAVWKRPIIFLLVGVAVLTVLVVFLFSKISTTSKDYYPQTITEVTTRVLENVNTVSLSTMENLSEIALYCTDDCYAFLQFTRATLGTPEYPNTSWKDLPAEVKDYSALKEWLKETGYTSAAYVVEVTPTKYTDPNEAEAVATVVMAIYTKEQKYINQFEQVFLVSLVRGGADQSYWVVNDISPYVPTEETSTGS